jgi:hypothetical protein
VVASSPDLGAPAVMSLVMVSFRAYHSVTRPPKSSMNRLDAVEGDVLCRPGGKPWGLKGSEAILIVASGTCDFCQADIPFEESLWRTAKTESIPVYYILADRDSNRNRIRELRSSGRTVMVVKSLRQFGLARVPTIARVDDSGRVLSKWTGNVTAGNNGRVMESILHGTGLQRYESISEEEMKGRAASAQAQVLAFSSLHLSVPSTVMRPADVDVRARREMNPHVSTIVDCTRVRNALSCQDAALELRMADFREVAVAGLKGKYTSPCGGQQ